MQECNNCSQQDSCCGFEWYTQIGVGRYFGYIGTNMKKLKNSVYYLLAAGALTAANTENDDKQSFQESKDGFFIGKAYVSDINDSQSYTLAQHSSHASHGSHGSPHLLVLFVPFIL